MAGDLRRRLLRELGDRGADRGEHLSAEARRRERLGVLTRAGGVLTRSDDVLTRAGDVIRCSTGMRECANDVNVSVAGFVSCIRGADRRRRRMGTRTAVFARFPTHHH